MYLFREKKNYWITAVPATFMSAVSMTYFFCADECLGFSTAVAYPVGIILAALFLGIFIWATRCPTKAPTARSGTQRINRFCNLF